MAAGYNTLMIRKKADAVLYKYCVYILRVAYGDTFIVSLRNNLIVNLQASSSRYVKHIIYSGKMIKMEKRRL